MSFAVERVDHVELYVRDIESAIGWYREVLGLEVLHRWEPYPVMIGAGGTALALFLAKPQSEPPPPASVPSPMRFRRVAWRTDSDGFAKAQQHLASHDVAFEGPIDHGVSHSIYFTDPDGHSLEITCYRDPSTMRTVADDKA